MTQIPASNPGLGGDVHENVERVIKLNKILPSFAKIPGREAEGVQGLGDYLNATLTTVDLKGALSALSEDDPAMSTSAIAAGISSAVSGAVAAATPGVPVQLGALGYGSTIPSEFTVSEANVTYTITDGLVDLTHNLSASEQESYLRMDMPLTASQLPVEGYLWGKCTKGSVDNDSAWHNSIVEFSLLNQSDVVLCRFRVDDNKAGPSMGLWDGAWAYEAPGGTEEDGVFMRFRVGRSFVEGWHDVDNNGASRYNSATWDPMSTGQQEHDDAGATATSYTLRISIEAVGKDSASGQLKHLSVYQLGQNAILK